MRMEDPRIRPPYRDNTAEILLLKAILAELTRLRLLLEKEVDGL